MQNNPKIGMYVCPLGKVRFQGNSLGRNLIENLYATLLAAFWPFIYFYENSNKKLFLQLDLQAWFLVLFAFLFICDDYYTTEKALQDFRPGGWRNSSRFWIDIFIMVLFFGFIMSAFTNSFLMYIIILIYFLGWIWCRLLRKDIENSNLIDSNQGIYIQHLERQQRLYLWAMIIYASAGLLNNIFWYLKNENQSFIFNYGMINWKNFQITLDVNMLVFLWAMLIAHWLIRCASLMGAVIENNKIASSMVKINNLLYKKPFLSSLFKKIRNTKKIYVFLIAIILTAVTSDVVRAIILALGLTCWVLFEFFNGKGLLYQICTRTKIETQSESEDQAKEAIKFLNEI